MLDQIDSIFAAMGASTSLVGAVDDVTVGKMYEAWVLACVLRDLQTLEGFSIRFVGGTKALLKASGGPINPNYPHFEIIADDLHFDVWTDIEFRTLSYKLRGGIGIPDIGDRHELDIVVVPHGTTGYPAPEEIVWGIECKNTLFLKSMARAMFGVRRELSFLDAERRTPFKRWPIDVVPASPPSVLTAYSSDSAVTHYQRAGAVFGVQFVEIPLPI